MKIINLIFVTAALTIFISCNRTKNGQINTSVVNNPNTASNAKKGEEPVFKFDTEIHDFGKVVQGEKVAFNFKFKNTGKSDLLISNAYASCGCTVPKFSKEPIKPGQDGVIEVVFNTEGKKGMVEKFLIVLKKY